MRNPFLLLLLVFLISIAIRVPNINRPLSKHHEFCTAIALRVLNIWDKNGIGTYNALPVMTYGQSTDKNINNHACTNGKMLDAEGNFYYVSHPPLGYYLPYAVLKTFGLQFSVSSIQWFHIAIGGLCGLGIFGITNLLIGKPMQAWTMGAFMASTAYWINPATLWFQSNTYMSDMMVQPFFIALILLVLLNKTSIKHSLLMVLFLFMAAYTTWFGYLIGLVLVAYYWLAKKQKLTGLLLSIAMGAAALLTVYQYSSINGFDAYISEAFLRFDQRGLGGFSAPFKSLFTISFNYLTSYGVLLITIPVVFYVRKRRALSGLKLITFLAVTPVVLLHLLLSDYSGHDFTTLHFAVWLSVAAGLYFNYCFSYQKTNVSVVAVCIGIIGIAQYYYINPPGNISLQGDRYDTYQSLAEQVLTKANSNQVIFIQGFVPSPEFIYYLGRNAKRVDEESDAIGFLETYNQPQGILFEIEDNEIRSSKILSLP